MDLLEGEEVGRAAGARLGREFGGRADQLADAVGVLVLRKPMPPRSMFYAPARIPGRHGAVAIPADATADVEQAMIAVAVGLHLVGDLRPAIYLDGRATQEMPRHRAAAEFALGFMRALPARPRVREVGARFRAG